MTVQPEVPQRRVVVTSARTSAVHRTRGATASREIDEQTALGEVLVRSLMRAQLRIAFYAFAATAVLLGGLPLLFAVAPQLAGIHVLGVPLTWLLLAVAVYPLVCLAGWAYVRAAERNEKDFTDLVDRS
ncbi:MAG TPA: DUF485 domain-containing protein [Actinomycetes bacterium]